MIKSFKCRETERLFHREISRKFPSDIQRAALRKLRMLNRSQNLNDLKVPPGNRLEALTADRKGQYSIRINERWRICFSWRKSDAFDVEITDYH
jgi:proteic killer suppression protein